MDKLIKHVGATDVRYVNVTETKGEYVKLRQRKFVVAGVASALDQICNVPLFSTPLVSSVRKIGTSLSTTCTRRYCQETTVR